MPLHGLNRAHMDLGIAFVRARVVRVCIYIAADWILFFHAFILQYVTFNGPADAEHFFGVFVFFFISPDFTRRKSDWQRAGGWGRCGNRISCFDDESFIGDQFALLRPPCSRSPIVEILFFFMLTQMAY